MQAPELDVLLELRGYVQIAHHVRGRVRLRINYARAHKIGREDRERIGEALRSIPGINAVRMNLAAGSVVIEYAPAKIAPDSWDIVLLGDPQSARERLDTILGPASQPLDRSEANAAPHRSSTKEDP
ncbi:MAG: cation transporter [Thioalkalivibrio sp.]|jgi:hypothetical protein|nr:cation transporter [Thioalkalivibrio sp.]